MTKERLQQIQAMLTPMVKRRKALGEYNADAGDITALADAMLILVEQELEKPWWEIPYSPE